MVVLNQTNQRASNYIKSYFNSNAEWLFQVYKTHSIKKECAYKDCLSIQNRCYGSNGRIVSYNQNYFTYGFMANSLKLDMQILVIITYSDIYLIPSKNIGAIERENLKNEFTMLLYFDRDKEYI